MDNENEKQLNKKAKVLRTYTTDMAEAIRQDEVSIIKIALAEKARKEREELEKKAEGSNLTKTVFLLGGLALLVIAGLVIYFLFFKKTETVPPPKENRIETFLSYDSSSKINVSEVESVNSLTSLINDEEVKLSGMIKSFFFINKKEEKEEIISPSAFLSLSGMRTPDSLLRFLSNNYLFGEYSIESTDKQNIPFLILETSNYNQSYASMLEWEKTMLQDFFFLFEIKLPEGKLPVSYRKWSDLVVKNKDTRVLYDEYGKSLLYYTFINKNSFVITTDLEALREIIDRILTKNL
jgi:flagellar basal body-associated protein FliL